MKYQFQYLGFSKAEMAKSFVKKICIKLLRTVTLSFVPNTQKCYPN